MPGSFFIIRELSFHDILEKEESENNKHDEKLKQNDGPHGSSPGRHIPEPCDVEIGYVFQFSHKLSSPI
jgi:hypothetical protein